MLSCLDEGFVLSFFFQQLLWHNFAWFSPTGNLIAQVCDTCFSRATWAFPRQQKMYMSIYSRHPMERMQVVKTTFSTKHFLHNALYTLFTLNTLYCGSCFTLHYCIPYILNSGTMCTLLHSSTYFITFHDALEGCSNISRCLWDVAIFYNSAWVPLFVYLEFVVWLCTLHWTRTVTMMMHFSIDLWSFCFRIFFSTTFMTQFCVVFSNRQSYCSGLWYMLQQSDLGFS